MKRTSYNFIGYINAGVLIMLVACLAWIAVGKTINVALQDKLNEERLQSEKLLAEKLLWEKRFTRAIDISQFESSINKKSMTCDQLAFINTQLFTKLHARLDSLRILRARCKALHDSIAFLRNEQASLTGDYINHDLIFFKMPSQASLNCAMYEDEK